MEIEEAIKSHNQSGKNNYFIYSNDQGNLKCSWKYENINYSFTISLRGKSPVEVKLSQTADDIPFMFNFITKANGVFEDNAIESITVILAKVADFLEKYRELLIKHIDIKTESVI